MGAEDDGLTDTEADDDEAEEAEAETEAETELFLVSLWATTSLPARCCHAERKTICLLHALCVCAASPQLR